MREGILCLAAVRDGGNWPAVRPEEWDVVRNELPSVPSYPQSRATIRLKWLCYFFGARSALFVSIVLQSQSRIILGTMEDESWTGVKIVYVCPQCRMHGRQFFAVEAVGLDREKARAAAWKQRSSCRSCNEPLPSNLDIDLDIIVASVDHLRKAGYPRFVTFWEAA